MRLLNYFPLCTLVLYSGLVSAQVYESYDSSGNPVFSGAPSANSVRVDISHTNIADPVQGAENAGSLSDAPARPSNPRGSVTREERVRIVSDGRNEDPRDLVDDPESLRRHEVGDENLHRHQVGNHLVEHRHAKGAEAHDHTLSGLGDSGATVQRHIVIHHRGHR